MLYPEALDTEKPATRAGFGETLTRMLLSRRHARLDMDTTTEGTTTGNGANNGTGTTDLRDVSASFVAGAPSFAATVVVVPPTTTQAIAAERSLPPAVGAHAASSVVHADDLDFGEEVPSTRDRTLESRLAHAIETGAGLEEADADLAAVQAFLADHEEDADPYGASSEFRDLLRFNIPKLLDADYESYRKVLAKGADIRVSFLDEKRKKARKSAVGVERDVGMWTCHTPWPDPVDADELLTDLVRLLTKHIHLPDGAATTLALWTVFSHAHDLFHVSPLLGLSSPEKRCGKTSVLYMLMHLLPRPLTGSNTTAAAMFRSVDKWRPSLLIDEADTMLRDNDELRTMLNSGHYKAFAQVPRCDGEDNEVKMFDTFCPKAIAMIGQIPDTLADRSIAVRMQRKPPGSEVERLRMDAFDASDEYRQAARWVADNANVLLAMSDPVMPDGLNDRACDNWRPLLSIADVAGGRWPAVAREACLLLTRLAADDKESWGAMLLADMQQLFNEIDEESVSSADAVDKLNELEHRPWPEVSRGKPLTVRGLAARLRKYGIEPKRLPRTAGKRVRGYFVEDFAEAFLLYVHTQVAGFAVPTVPTDPTDAKSLQTKDLARNSAGTDEQSGTDDPSRDRCGTDGEIEVSRAKPLQTKDLARRGTDEQEIPGVAPRVCAPVTRCAFDTCSRLAVRGGLCKLHG